jgi:dihydroorotate dehydrogenase
LEFSRYLCGAMYPLIKKILFLLSAEKAHHFAMRACGVIISLPGGKAFLRACFCYRHPALKRTLFGITFPNPVGLAAGFDKDARYVDILACLGFGFVEIGTVTPLPQPGNDRPRLFRLPADGALINRMGFNNQGAAAAAGRLGRRKSRVIVGGNIGKNKTTPNEKALDDYARCFNALYSVVDYFVVNVSSPNTPGLRSLQQREPLRQLLLHLQNLNGQRPLPKPILLKIAPDLSDDELDDIIAIATEVKLSGIVATNTTIGREGLRTSADKVIETGAGGLSGKPLAARSTEVIRYVHAKTAGKLPIIASGGIFTPADAQEKLAAGASLVQLYTGFIYEGPAVAARICKRLAKGV